MGAVDELRDLRRSVEDLADEFETRRALAYAREEQADKDHRKNLGDQEYGAQVAWHKARDAVKRIVTWR